MARKMARAVFVLRKNKQNTPLIGGETAVFYGILSICLSLLTCEFKVDRWGESSLFFEVLDKTCS